MSEERFTVQYDGPALVEHHMDAKDLARSLIAMSEAFQIAQRLVVPGVPPAALHATATAPGSFEVAMALIQPGGIVDGAMEWLLDRPAQSLVTAGGLTSMVWGTFSAIKALRGRRIRGAQPAATPGSFTITTEDGATITLPAEQVTLLRSIEFRKSAAEVVEPLAREGVTTFRVRDSTVRLEVGADERRFFYPPELPDSEELALDRRDALIQVVGVEFDWRKWRFTEGGGVTFHAAVEDHDFRTKIEHQEITLGANDLLRVRLRTRQYRDRAGVLRAEKAIEQVYEHIDGGRQLPLELEPDEYDPCD